MHNAQKHPRAARERPTFAQTGCWSSVVSILRLELVLFINSVYISRMLHKLVIEATYLHFGIVLKETARQGTVPESVVDRCRILFI